MPPPLRTLVVLTLTALSLLWAPPPQAYGQGAPGADDTPALKTPTSPGDPAAAPRRAPVRKQRAGIPTVIDFYTMGAGDYIFSAWGHAGLCVTDVLSPKGRCYNFGTTDFSDPIKLVWGFLRGDAQFWVSESSLERMLKLYEVTNRTVWRQRLPLSQDVAQRAAQALATEVLPENRGYIYHHFKDNCATRLRDHIDLMMDGKFREGATTHFDGTYRTETLAGFTGYYPVTVLTLLMVGDGADLDITDWEAMFLPDIMRQHLETNLGIKAEVINERKGPVPSGNPNSGPYTLYGMAIFFSLLLAGGARIGGKALAGAAILTGFVYGLLGFLIWGLYLSTSIPELVSNRTLLFWLPLDFLLFGLRGLRLKRYALFRLGTCALTALLWAFGVTGQPLFAPLVAVALPMAALYFSIPETDPRAESPSPAHA